MKQKWFCHNCNAYGVTEIDKEEGVWSVMNKIASQHTKTSNKCNTGIVMIRLESKKRKKS